MIYKSNFTYNKADLGGASYYFDKFPLNHINCIFTNNSALYGDINGSYPIRLQLSEATMQKINYQYPISNMPSGIVIPIPIEIEVSDIYDQKINIINNGFISIGIKNLSLTNNDINQCYQNIKGTINQKIVNGSAVFDHFMIFTNPVNITIILEISTPIINENLGKIDRNLINLTTYEDIINNKSYYLNIPINIRPCIIGEIYDDSINSCYSCPINTYSFNNLDTKCTECFLEAECYGGMNVSLHKGYWRSSAISTYIHHCEPNSDSCL